GQTAVHAPTLFLEGESLGQGRTGVSLEPASLVVYGVAQARRLARLMDWLRQEPRTDSGRGAVRGRQVDLARGRPPDQCAQVPTLARPTVRVASGCENKASRPLRYRGRRDEVRAQWPCAADV